MNLTPSDSSVDQTTPDLTPCTPAWRCVPAMLIFSGLAVLVLLGAALTNVGMSVVDGFELMKVVGVVAFVGAMVALALGMVGDSFRS